MFPGVINQLFALFLGVWLPQHVRVGWKRLVCVQGDALALPEVLLSNRTWKAAGPRAHLTSRAIKKNKKKRRRHTTRCKKTKQKTTEIHMKAPHIGYTFEKHISMHTHRTIKTLLYTHTQNNAL